MTYTAPLLANGTPYDASLWQAALDEIARLSAAAASVHTTVDACRITTSGAYLGATSTDPSEAVKLRSASITITSGDLYRFHGQTLYLCADPWALEIRKGSTSGTLLGGARLDASAAGANIAWDVTWPCAATETTQIYYVLNRISGSGSITLFGIQDGFGNAYANIDRVGTSAQLRDVA